MANGCRVAEKVKTSFYCDLDQGQYNVVVTVHSYPAATSNVRRLLLDDPHTFYCDDYFVLGEVHMHLRVFSNRMIPWISLIPFHRICCLLEAIKQR